MAIDIQSLFNPGSLQQMAETEDEKKKRAQLTGTMNLGGQTGTFTGTFDPNLFQQQTNTSAPVGYQPPPNYGMTAPPEQQPVPVIQPPALPPPVGASPISGEYNIPDQQPVPLPPGNQPYVAPPAEPYQAPPNYYGDLTPGQALGGEFTMQPPAQTAPGNQPYVEPPLPLPIAGPIESGPVTGLPVQTPTNPVDPTRLDQPPTSDPFAQYGQYADRLNQEFNNQKSNYYKNEANDQYYSNPTGFLRDADQYINQYKINDYYANNNPAQNPLTGGGDYWRRGIDWDSGLNYGQGGEIMSGGQLYIPQGNGTYLNVNTGKTMQQKQQAPDPNNPYGIFVGGAPRPVFEEYTTGPVAPNMPGGFGLS